MQGSNPPSRRQNPRHQAALLHLFCQRHVSRAVRHLANGSIQRGGETWAYFRNQWWNMLVVEPTQLKKYARQNGFIFPNFQGENKTLFELPPPSEIMDRLIDSTNLDVDNTHAVFSADMLTTNYVASLWNACVCLFVCLLACCLYAGCIQTCWCFTTSARLQYIYSKQTTSQYLPYQEHLSIWFISCMWCWHMFFPW